MNSLQKPLSFDCEQFQWNIEYIWKTSELNYFLLLFLVNGSLWSKRVTEICCIEMEQSEQKKKNLKKGKIPNRKKTIKQTKSQPSYHIEYSVLRQLLTLNFEYMPAGIHCTFSSVCVFVFFGNAEQKKKKEKVNERQRKRVRKKKEIGMGMKYFRIFHMHTQFILYLRSHKNPSFTYHSTTNTRCQIWQPERTITYEIK